MPMKQRTLAILSALGFAAAALAIGDTYLTLGSCTVAIGAIVIVLFAPAPSHGDDRR